MPIAYFDCFSGISGDMLVGALLDLGFPKEKLRDEIQKVSLSGYCLEIGKESRGPIGGTRFKVIIDPHNRIVRTYRDIKEIIQTSGLDDDVKEKSLNVFYRLASAESRVHRGSVEGVHFHEVGAVDAIIDVVGSIVGLKFLEIDTIFGSKIPLGRGFIKCDHGVIPIPAPATLLLLENVPVYDSGQKRELVTPTGAAILTTMARDIGRFPDMKPIAVGYGVGKNPMEQPPNLLRVILGNQNEIFQREILTTCETNVDDMNPQFFDYLLQCLLDAGALDVNIIPAQMKKNRPGSLLRVLVSPDLRDKVEEVLFRETTTLGIRSYDVSRIKLQRKYIDIDTCYGTFKVKIAWSPDNNISRIYPEYDDCKKVAEERKIPLQVIYDEIREKARKILRR